MSNQEDSFKRGDIWLTDLSPFKTAELARARLSLIVSANQLNDGPAGIVIVLPVTTRNLGIPSHVRINPPEGGSNKESFILCEQVQCVNRERLIKRLGAVEPSTMTLVDDYLSTFLNLFAPD